MKRLIMSALGIIAFANISFAQTLKVELPFYNWKMKDAPGKQEFEMYCLMCHSPGYVFDQSEGKTDPHLWEHVVRQMIEDFKAPIPEDAAEKIIKYLNENYSNTKFGF